MENTAVVRDKGDVTERGWGDLWMCLCFNNSGVGKDSLVNSFTLCWIYSFYLCYFWWWKSQSFCDNLWCMCILRWVCKKCIFSCSMCQLHWSVQLMGVFLTSSPRESAKLMLQEFYAFGWNVRKHTVFWTIRLVLLLPTLIWQVLTAAEKYIWLSLVKIHLVW